MTEEEPRGGPWEKPCSQRKPEGGGNLRGEVEDGVLLLTTHGGPRGLRGRVWEGVGDGARLRDGQGNTGITPGAKLWDVGGLDSAGDRLHQGRMMGGGWRG